MNYCIEKKILGFAFVFLLTINLHANDWKIEGNVKAGYVEYDYSNPPPSSSSINYGRTDSKGFYTTPKFSLSTPQYNNFSAKATIAGATDFGINSSKYETKNFVFDATDNKSFAILQELFITYKDKNHYVSLGRQEIVTPLIESDDYYFLANSYEVANYINSSLNNFDFHLGYFYKMSGVWDSGANGTEFHSMSDASFVDSRDKNNANDSGVIYGAVEYKDNAHKLKIWEYYIDDLYNIFLTQYDFSNSSHKFFSYNLGAQFTNYKEVGQLASNNFTQIDYTIYSAKFDGKFSNGISFATGATKYSDGEGQSSTLGAYGGFPSYTYGFIYSYFTMGSLQNASVYKVEVGYDLEKIGLKNSWIGYRHTLYNLDSTYSKTATGAPQDKMILNGLRIKYATNMGIYFTGTYEHRNLDNEKDSSALRLIGGYKF